MPSLTRRPGDRRILASAILLAVTFLLIATLPTVLSSRVIAIGDQVVHDTDVLAASGRDVTRLMVDQESGLRGYVLTGDPRFLEPYELAGRDLESAWQPAEQAAVRVGGAAPGLIWSMRAAADEWRAAASQPAIDLVRAGRQADATALAATGQGKVRFDRFREYGRALLEHVDAVRARQMAERQSLVQVRTIVLVLLGLLAACGLVLIYQLATRSQHYLIEAAANEGIIQAKDQFLAIAAHELRTPLTSIKGHAQMLLRHGRTPATPSQADWERALKHAATIDRQSTRLTRLIDQLLEVTGAESKLIDLRREPTDLVALVEQVVDQFRPVAPIHPIEVEAPERPVMVELDRQRVEQVLFNLVDNAVKYSPEGGAVSVAIRRQGDEALVAVRDAGIGVPVAEHGQVFDRFYRASNVVGTSISGMGVGLYISRAIVMRHGGRVRIEGAPDGGTVVSVVLPIGRTA